MSKIKSKTRISLKRILSIFLTLMLVQAAIPFTSFAESDEPKVHVLNGGTNTDLKNTINDAKDGDTIQINGTIIMGETVEINKNINLKGSGSLLRNHTNGPIIEVSVKSPGKLTMEEITIDGDNLSSKNAAVEVSEKSELTMTSGTITGNFSSSEGGIFNNGTVTINGGTISENTSQYGGGIYNSGTLTVNNVTIKENTAKHNGGGIYNDGTLIMSGGTISGNSAIYDGGGIYNYGTLTINSGTIKENTAKHNGGGIYSHGTLQMLNGTISGNSTSTDNGGGICNSGTLTISGGIISGNSSIYDGGGIYNDGTVTVDGGTIKENTAKHNGGGIYNDVTLQMLDGTITENSAIYDGGGIYNYGTLTVDGGTIKENTAKHNGGGIYNDKNLTMNRGTISGNSAIYDGGGVYTYKGTQFNVQGSVKIIDNGMDKNDNVAFSSEDDYITITGEFTGLIKVKQNSFNKAVVKPIEDYNITQSDLSRFEADGEDTYLNLIGNEIIYMEDKTDWGQMVQNKGVTYYVDENGKASAEVGGNGRIWLNTKADGSGIWYCIDNSNGLFRTGSRFYVQVIDDISKYYDKIGSEYKDKIEDGKLTIFLIGVTDPDGNEYTTLDSDLTCYVKIDPNWDKDKLSAIFINGEMTEKIDVEYAGTIEGPSSEDKFAKLVIKHFSPYAIYQAKSNDAEVTQMDTNANSINTNDSNLKNSLATGENFNYVYILSLWAASIIALSGIVILKRKFSK